MATFTANQILIGDEATSILQSPKSTWNATGNINAWLRCVSTPLFLQCNSFTLLVLVAPPFPEVIVLS
jgi:hypothetical protein